METTELQSEVVLIIFILTQCPRSWHLAPYTCCAWLLPTQSPLLTSLGGTHLAPGRAAWGEPPHLHFWLSSRVCSVSLSVVFAFSVLINTTWFPLLFSLSLLFILFLIFQSFHWDFSMKVSKLQVVFVQLFFQSQWLNYYVIIKIIISLILNAHHKTIVRKHLTNRDRPQQMTSTVKWKTLKDSFLCFPWRVPDSWFQDQCTLKTTSSLRAGILFHSSFLSCSKYHDSVFDCKSNPHTQLMTSKTKLAMIFSPTFSIWVRKDWRIQILLSLGPTKSTQIIKPSFQDHLVKT